MDFNIKKHIDLLKKRSDFRKDESIIEDIVLKETGISVENMAHISPRDVLTFPALPSVLLVKIKCSKEKIISAAKERKVFISHIM